MSVTISVVILLVLNVGLIWFFLAAPVGVRTVRLSRLLPQAPADVWPAVNPFGPKADWHHAVISSRPVAENRVEQAFVHLDRKGEPIRRIFEIDALQSDPPAHFGYEAKIVEDSALDGSFWKDYHETRALSATEGGTVLTIEQTDRYKGAAFLIFRYFSLRREVKALEGWLKTGVSQPNGIFEHPAMQVALAVLSTLILWPFFGLSVYGLALSTLLTVIIVLHELGHMAAYRAFGHRKVRMIFIPLLGGIAIGGRPYNSLFEVATCALMGAGMSAFLVPVAIGLHEIAEALPGFHLVESGSLVFLLVLGAFNLLNLLPMSRFDGGQVLRQVVTTKNGLIAGSFSVTLAILWVGWRIGVPSMALIAGLAVFTVLSLISMGSVKPRHKLDAISGSQRLLVGVGLYAALLLHGYAIIYACDRLFR
ncbi:hypothetical protein [Pararhizobium sp.]|uniref:hypothetical protein n=1 Tax=Pararhizobium sp. TaxID=1977563 RepID=UPI002726C363|nr:hypothetical protein [Pararhizobium sp.]MDO9415321.1 hypothetical protein [Pararhizobium sp.]